MKIVKKDQQVPNHKDEKTYVVDIKNRKRYIGLLDLNKASG